MPFSEHEHPTATKLVSAAIVAYHAIPSSVDVATLQALGYKDVQDVAASIARFNELQNEHDLHYPLPLSWRPEV